MLLVQNSAVRSYSQDMHLDDNIRSSNDWNMTDWIPLKVGIKLALLINTDVLSTGIEDMTNTVIDATTDNSTRGCWGNNLVSERHLTLSLAVNAIFTGLLVFKISKTSLAIRPTRPRGKHDYYSETCQCAWWLAAHRAQVVWVRR